MKTMGAADPIRAALRPLAKRIGLALIYGSVARGEDRAQSDIDLLVVGTDLTLEDLFRRLKTGREESRAQDQPYALHVRRNDPAS